jgi:hypothetical protein
MLKEFMTNNEFQEIGKQVVNQLKTKNCIHLYKHLEGLSVNAIFSEDKLLRYKLEVESTFGNQIVCAIMQNPSYANELLADKSVNILEQIIFSNRISKFQNIKKLIIVNLFAFIQTNDFNGSIEQNDNKNDEMICLAIKESDEIIIGWGVDNYFERINYVYSVLRKYQEKVIYKTRKHPSLGSVSEEFIVEHRI